MLRSMLATDVRGIDVDESFSLESGCLDSVSGSVSESVSISLFLNDCLVADTWGCWVFFGSSMRDFFLFLRMLGSLTLDLALSLRMLGS